MKQTIVANDKMQRGYVYCLTEPFGRNFAPGFEFLNIRGAFDLIKTYAAGVDGSGKPSAETLFTSWYDEARAKGMDESLSDIFHDNPATLGSFQLLAVANRMDMAQWDGQKWIHAEVHMAYGLTPEPDGSPINLTVIVDAEAVHPAMRRLHAEFFGGGTK